MCNYRGELSECSQANFFMVRRGAALTPSIRSRPARGRDPRVSVRGRARTSASTSATRRCSRADLETADEAFITSTTRELSPVTRIDGRIIGNGKPGSGHA